MATALSSSSLMLTWLPPPPGSHNGIIREYRINITEIQTGNTFLLSSTSLTIAVTSLHPYYTYECTVSAYTVATGPFTEPTIITTPEDGIKFECLTVFACWML